MIDVAASIGKPIGLCAMCLILIYSNSFFTSHADFDSLPEDCRGVFTLDPRRFHEADAVVFHPPTMDRIENLEKPPGQLWVMASGESVVNYPVVANSAFRSLFDLIMTYERHADIFDAYIPQRETWYEAMARPVPAKSATVPCVLFQSDPISRSGRTAYISELMKYVGVHSYGKVFNNCAMPKEDRGQPTKLEIVSRYKFCLSMENSICEDYVTEKLFDPFRCGSVPVYLGAPNVDQYAPNDHAFINVRDFAGPAKLAEFLRHLDQDDAAYAAYFDWHKRPLRPSLLQDIDRMGSALVKLRDAVKARLPVTRDPNVSPVRLSFDPKIQGLADFSMPVSNFLYGAHRAREAEKPRNIISRIGRKARRLLRTARDAIS